VRSDAVEAGGAGVAELGLVELTLVGLGNAESPVSFVFAVLLQILEEILGSFGSLLVARVDRVGKLLHQGEDVVDDLVVLFGLEDGQNGADIGGRRARVEDHGDGGNSDFVVSRLVGEDGHEVADTLSGHDSIPTSGPDSVRHHLAGFSFHFSVDEGLQLLRDTSVTDVLQNGKSLGLGFSGSGGLVVVPELGDILGSEAAEALLHGGDISGSGASDANQVTESEGNGHLDESFRSGSGEGQELLVFLDELSVGSADVEGNGGEDAGGIAVVIELVLQDQIADGEGGSGGSSGTQKLEVEVGLHDSIFGLVSQEFFSQTLQAVVVQSVDGGIESVDAVLVSLLDGLGGVIQSVEDLLLGLESALESGLGFSLVV